ncbi:MAG TPA: aminoglycoside phosphotransferase family protein [Streptosporangiaceae bacterium]|nr:aminoglycoside phosphotransferase family protein [Streptosporangiaceae bacterium]
MSWLSEPTPAAVAAALRVAAPALSALPVTLPDLGGGDDPVWRSLNAPLGAGYFVRFAWSERAARFVQREISALGALAESPAVPFLPEVVATGTSPLILVTRRVPGASLFAVAGSISLDQAGQQLARFLAALHRDTTRQRVEAATGPAAAWYPLVTTDELRARFGRWVTPGQQRTVARWCDWADQTLAGPRPPVLVHADLHGDNMVWDGGRLRAVLDFTNVGTGEPEFDLRTFPGPGLGPDLELLTAIMRHYQPLAGRELSLDRVMAWHVRQALGDVLWRSEAGLPLADRRRPGEWVTDLEARFRATRSVSW